MKNTASDRASFLQKTTFSRKKWGKVRKNWAVFNKRRFLTATYTVILSFVQERFLITKQGKRKWKARWLACLEKRWQCSRNSHWCYTTPQTIEKTKSWESGRPQIGLRTWGRKMRFPIDKSPKGKGHNATYCEIVYGSTEQKMKRELGTKLAALQEQFFSWSSPFVCWGWKAYPLSVTSLCR